MSSLALIGLVIAMVALSQLSATVDSLISRGRVWWWALIAYGGGLLAGAVTIFIGTWRLGISLQTMMGWAVVGGIAAIVAFLIGRGWVRWWPRAYDGGILAGGVSIFILNGIFIRDIVVGFSNPDEAVLVWGLLILLAAAIGALAAALSKGSCTPS